MSLGSKQECVSCHLLSSANVCKASDHQNIARYLKGTLWSFWSPAALRSYVFSDRFPISEVKMQTQGRTSDMTHFPAKDYSPVSLIDSWWQWNSKSEGDEGCQQANVDLNNASSDVPKKAALQMWYEEGNAVNMHARLHGTHTMFLNTWLKCALQKKSYWGEKPL